MGYGRGGEELNDWFRDFDSRGRARTPREATGGELAGTAVSGLLVWFLWRKFACFRNVVKAAGSLVWRAGRLYFTALWWVSRPYVRRADMPPMNRGDAAAATRIFRGDGSRRPRCGHSVETGRGDAAPATRIVRGDRGRDADVRLRPTRARRYVWVAQNILLPAFGAVASGWYHESQRQKRRGATAASHNSGSRARPAGSGGRVIKSWTHCELVDRAGRRRDSTAGIHIIPRRLVAHVDTGNSASTVIHKDVFDAVYCRGVEMP